MTAFWIITGLLIVGALLFIVPPLLRRTSSSRVSRDAVNVAVYRDQLRELDLDLQCGTLSPEHHDKARRELEARLLEDVNGAAAAARIRLPGRGAAIALGLAIPLCALGVYFVVGNPQALLPQAAGDAAHGLSEQQMQALIDRLAARLKNNPEDAEGWIMLARSYSLFGRFSEASTAYANAAARLPNDAQLLADYADALAMAQDKRLQGEPEKIIARALQADPNNLKALALAGTVAFENKNYGAALDHWERILRLAPQDSEFAQAVRASVAEARARGGSAVSGRPAQPPAASVGRVSGLVKLAPELAAKIKPDDTVFIFARAAEGPRMPLAILRKQARDLPFEFALDDSMAMTAETKLSAYPRIVVGARISKSANAAPQPGDLQGLSTPIEVGAERVNVVIDTELR